MIKLAINKEISEALPPLSTEEYDALEASLLKEGCRDPLVICPTKYDNTYDILIDGHNRYRICQQFGIPFKTITIDFKTGLDAIGWVKKNQFARRNMTKQQRDEYIGQRYLDEKKEVGTNQHIKEGMQTCTPSETADKIAREENTSPRNVHNQANYKQALNKIEDQVGTEIKQKISKGELKITKQQIKQIATLPSEKIKTTVVKTQQGKDVNKILKKEGIVTRKELRFKAHKIVDSFLNSEISIMTLSDELEKLRPIYSNVE